jgi:hypothetical protein
MTTTALPRTRPASPTFSSALARPLLDEWARLCSTRRTRSAIAAWELPGGEFIADPEQLLERLGFFGRLDDDRADAALFVVVRLAKDDLLAARVVLQRVLPALVAIAKRRGGRRWDARQEAFTDVVSAAWIVIRTYPIARRPQRVAANIVRDAEYHAFVRARRLRSNGEQVGRIPVELDAVVGPDGARLDAPTEPMEQVLEILTVARDHGLSDDDLRFAGGLLSGRSSREMAAEFQICERSARNRRDLVASRLRAAVRAAEAA